MRRVIRSLKETWNDLGRDIYVGERYRSNMRALFFVSIVSTVLGLILLVVDIVTQNHEMMYASVLTLLAGCGCAFCTKILKNRNIAILIPVWFSGFMITFYILGGIGSGTSILWALLVPIGVSYFVKVKYGIILSTYYTVLFAVVFYSPLNARYLQYYDHEFIVRFPLLYAALSIFTGMAMIQHHRSVLFEIDHTHELTEKLEKKTAEAEDLMEVMDIYVSAAIEDTDKISGIMNRRSGEMVIAQTMQNSPGCFVFFDVDNLKKINDYYGHEAGDRILRIMGETLQENSEDRLCCRLGGDEFLLFIKNVTEEEAVERVEKVISDFNYNKKDDAEVTIASLSAGMVMCQTGDLYADVYNKADKALYYVKQNGKSGFDFYNSEYDSVGRIHVNVEKLLAGIQTSGNYSGAMSVDYRQFTKLYEFIVNLEHRFPYSFKMVVISLEIPSGENPGSEELEQAMFCMEQSIRRMIRDVDILTRYSNRQFLVILLGVNTEGIETAMARVFDGYYKMRKSTLFEPTYMIADPDHMRQDSEAGEA